MVEKTKKNSQKYWILANAVGLAAFFYFSSWGWAPRGHEGELAGPGDPIIWGLTVFPVTVSFLVVNLVWFVMAILHIHRKHNWKPLVIWFSVILLWSAGWAYSMTRQYTGADMNQTELSK